MKKPGSRDMYAALIALLFAGVALWRHDLFLGAWRATVAILERGGPARWRLLGEMALFSAILLVTWREIPATTRPRRDAWIVVLGAALGWAAEAWGTRTGVWRYYTGERPPLWIVPVWPLGALLVERLSDRFKRGPAPAGRYWALAALAYGIFLAFTAPWLGTPAGLAAAALVAAALTVGVEPEEEFWPLAAGMACVFFADLWGTTNDCWRYYAHRLPLGLWRGIAFGMAFDAAVVLAVLRLARALDKRVFTDFYVAKTGFRG